MRGEDKKENFYTIKSGGKTGQNLLTTLSGKQVKEPPVGLRVQLPLLYLLKEERLDRVGQYPGKPPGHAGVLVLKKIFHI